VDTVSDSTFSQQYPTLPTVVQKSLTEVTKTTDNKDAFDGGADQVAAATAPPTSGSTGNGNGNGTASGSLPVTGTPILPIAVAGAVLVLLGALALSFGRRGRSAAKR
jgi:hypothetical protein